MKNYQGDDEAQHKVALMYESGLGVNQDYQMVICSFFFVIVIAVVAHTSNLAQAMKWNMVSANTGHPPALFSLAVMYQEGVGVPVMHDEALRLHRLAARWIFFPVY